MGRGVAQLCAQSGFLVLLYDAVPEALGKAKSRLREALSSGVQKGKLSAGEADAAEARVACTESLEGLADAKIVVEAAPEELPLKQRLFVALDRITAPSTVLATNTSSLLVAEIAAGVKHPDRVLGLHFFNPPVAMKLVEVARTRATSEEAYRLAWELVVALGKTPVAVKDTPGYVVNRVVRPFYLEAQRIAGEGRGSFRFVDQALRELGGVPMGPFELMDLIGLEVNLAISRSIHSALGSPERLKPHFIQERLVESGRFGRKTRKGFYVYEGGKPVGENPEALGLLPSGQTPTQPRYLCERILGAVSAEAALAAAEGVASEADIDTAVQLAMNFPKGPLQWRRDAAKAP